MAALLNWARNIEFSTDRLVRPTTVEQLQDVVASASRVRALGSGHSFNDIADTDGVLVSLADLDVEPSLTATSDGRLVCVGAGTRYGELAAYLQARGLALHNLGSLPHITVAGACATGTHGSGSGNGCLATAVRAVEFVRADGELVRMADGDADFPGSVLALGALGVVTRLWLAVRPSFELRQDVWLDAPLDSVLEHLGEIMDSAYSVSLFSDWQRPGVVDQIWLKAAAGAEPVDGNAWGASPATRAQHPIRDVDGAAATEQLGVPGPWNERLPHFRMDFTPSHGDEVQSEYFVAREHGPDAIRAIAGLALPPALMVGEIRTVAADELWLSPFRGRDTVALHFTWVADAGLIHDALGRVEAALAPFDARPHWAKAFRMPAEQVRAHHPELPRFAALAARLDPDRRFGNRYLETFVY
ncbi:FAD-binding protein [Jatrophihabitans endophyticus]|uniref:FAD-binding protein n=1 Tax=Jatrophihabitans endophyticus TaxID=1206085 RepID=UPI001A05F95A|nr:FAD-binding protein [Jatrophihabitans endophyticus]MBE7189576.1 FAD-binding protein [Jatrophihabitans endophyticus]